MRHKFLNVFGTTDNEKPILIPMNCIIKFLASVSEEKSTQCTFSVNSLILNKKDSHIKKKATVHNLIVFLNISIESKG